jgi:hypothetical protein
MFAAAVIGTIFLFCLWAAKAEAAPVKSAMTYNYFVVPGLGFAFGIGSESAPYANLIYRNFAQGWKAAASSRGYLRHTRPAYPARCAFARNTYPVSLAVFYVRDAVKGRNVCRLERPFFAQLGYQPIALPTGTSA